MAEASPPPRTTDEADDDNYVVGKPRVIATGGLKRVYSARQKLREKSRFSLVQAKVDSEHSDAESDEDDDRVVTPITQNTSNHYTLNMPGPAVPRSETPYILLG